MRRDIDRHSKNLMMGRTIEGVGSEEEMNEGHKKKADMVEEEKLQEMEGTQKQEWAKSGKLRQPRKGGDAQKVCCRRSEKAKLWEVKDAAGEGEDIKEE